MKTLLLDAMDKTSLVHKENHQTPSPSGYKMHYCSSNGCIQLEVQTDHSQNCSVEQACTLCIFSTNLVFSIVEDA